MKKNSAPISSNFTLIQIKRQFKLSTKKIPPSLYATLNPEETGTGASLSWHSVYTCLFGIFCI